MVTFNALDGDIRQPLINNKNHAIRKINDVRITPRANGKTGINLTKATKIGNNQARNHKRKGNRNTGETRPVGELSPKIRKARYDQHATRTANAKNIANPDKFTSHYTELAVIQMVHRQKIHIAAIQETHIPHNHNYKLIGYRIITTQAIRTAGERGGNIGRGAHQYSYMKSWKAI